MALPVRHLLAGSAVAGLLFLLPAGHANAQDNRNTGSWGGAVVVVLSFIAAAGGAVVGVKLASKGKRDESTMEPTLTQLNSSVKELNEKLTKLEAINLESKIDMVSNSVKEIDTELKGCINNSVNELTGTLGDKIDNLKTINSENEKALNDLDEKFSKSLEQCEDERKSLKMSVEEKEHRLKLQESNKDKQWKIMKDLCKNDKDNQKASPIDYLKLIKIKKSITCFDCLDAVGKLLSDSLEILPKAISSAREFEDFNSEKIDQLFELLWKLGTSFRDGMLQMKKSGEGSPRTSKVAKLIFGKERYAEKEKDNKRFSIEYQGESIDMSQHLKIDRRSNQYQRPGTNKTTRKSDNSCLRIHFNWHDESKKVLIGHCGRHR
ncbi:MAG: hypothetical protein F4025_08670 [Synechococcus sp. SB0669_bin_7]|nr:hypothetical protein [Synechococcus sp. SB0669_bin_7]